MQFQVADFNNAAHLFDTGAPADLWAELNAALDALPLCLQPSDQAKKVGIPIFDPKATNKRLTALAAAQGWHTVPVPEPLTMFGVDWDSGKGSVLAEWQFSNYPFLWNNIIRTEAVIKGNIALPGLDATEALVIVTKSGLFPSSNSTLYFEQAAAQIGAVTAFNAFDIPIRLVGLSLPANGAEAAAIWNEYPDRYSRVPSSTTDANFAIAKGKAGKHGSHPGEADPPVVSRTAVAPWLRQASVRHP